MQKDFAMFTVAGNAAVAGIVENAVGHFEDCTDAWEWAARELELLGTTSTYSEADDTAVREEVLEALSAAYPEVVFRSVRA